MRDLRIGDFVKTRSCFPSYDYGYGKIIEVKNGRFKNELTLKFKNGNTAIISTDDVLCAKYM